MFGSSNEKFDVWNRPYITSIRKIYEYEIFEKSTKKSKLQACDHFFDNFLFIKALKYPKRWRVSTVLQFLLFNKQRHFVRGKTCSLEFAACRLVTCFFKLLRLTRWTRKEEEIRVSNISILDRAVEMYTWNQPRLPGAFFLALDVGCPTPTPGKSALGTRLTWNPDVNGVTCSK